MIPPKKNMNPIHVRYYTANSRKKKEEKTESPLFIVIINVYIRESLINSAPPSYQHLPSSFINNLPHSSNSG